MSRKSELKLMISRVKFGIDQVARSKEIAEDLKNEIEEQMSLVMSSYPDYGIQEQLSWLQGVLDGLKVAELGEWD